MKKSDPQIVKAYHSKRFIESPEARPIRIVSEYLEPKARFNEQNVQDTILFFGSARIVSREAAEAELDALRKAGDDETAALLEADVGGPRDEVGVVGVGDGGERFHGAGNDDHAVGLEGAA